MNTFFRVCIYICLLMLAFTLIGNLIVAVAPGAFPGQSALKPELQDESSAITTLTGSTDGTLNAVWLSLISLTALPAIGMVFMTQSLVPIGVYLFGTFFWTSYIHLLSVFGFGFLPPELIAIFTVGLVFVFVAALIGIITGSG